MADDRSRLILNLALCYCHRRGVLSGAFPLPWAEAIDHELKVTPEERAEAIEMADDLEIYFGSAPHGS